jgi:CRP/FNR family transcriptional regulator, anaerobic regulatory protein
MNTITKAFVRCDKCEGCTMSHRAICRGAGPEALAELNRISHIREFAQGQSIQAQGEETTVVGNVIDGVVKLTTSSMDGHQHIVGLLFPSDFFGRVYVGTSRFSYEAATDVTLCCMNRKVFERFLSDHPEVEHELLVAKLDELDSVREWTSIVSGHTTMQRVATFLYILSKRSRNRECGRNALEHPIISIPISRRDIAAYLGTTPETLSRNIQAMSRRKVFRIIDAKHFELLNEAELIGYAGEAEEDLEEIASFRM